MAANGCILVLTNVLYLHAYGFNKKYANEPKYVVNQHLEGTVCASVILITVSHPSKRLHGNGSQYCEPWHALSEEIDCIYPCVNIQ